jgi:hypothetical protein
VLSTGFRALLPLIESKASQLLAALDAFSLYTQLAIKWVDVVSAIIIILVHMLLAVVVQMIQENKVRVLALYSEVRVSQVKDSLNKCTSFHQYMSLVKAPPSEVGAAKLLQEQVARGGGGGRRRNTLFGGAIRN